MTDYLTYQEVCKKLLLFTLQLIYTDEEDEEDEDRGGKAKLPKDTNTQRETNIINRYQVTK